MNLCLSYVSRIWRRKSTLLGLFLGVLIFLVCANYTASPSPDTVSPAAVAASKRVLVHAASGKRLHNYAGSEIHNNQVDDLRPAAAHAAHVKPSNRGVKFIAGDPSRPRKGLPSPKPRVSDDEVEYYKAKNHALYEAQAKIAKAKASSYLARHPHGNGNYNAAPPPQPSNQDDNVEYNQEQVVNGEWRGAGAPVYREDGNAANKYYASFNGKASYSDADNVLSEQPVYVAPQRLVHFDLKGAPPKVEYLKKVLKLSAGLGATGVLMEYEDMFPFTGKLGKAAAANHYSAAEVKELLDDCQALGLTVIPLVQTFGHLEFALKLPQYRHLRDVAEMPESICPCHPEAMSFVKEIIDQVVEAHPSATHVHVGCDEVFHLGECAECQGRNRNDIFVEHVSAVAKYVRQAHKRTPIVWDDMLRNLLPSEMGQLAAAGVEPMVWWYGEDIYRFIPTYTWDRYEEAFNTSWGASAFKGAHGPTLVVPPIRRHLDNNLAWTELMANEDPKFKQGFQGIVVTGWQRYDHFGVLAELLPSGIPSMAVDLVAVRDGFFNATNQNDVLKALECVGNAGGAPEVPFDYDSDPYLFDRMAWCYFPGNGVYKVARSLIATEREVAEFVKKVKRDKAWMTDFNVQHNYSSPFRVEELMEDWALTHSAVVQLARQAREALLEVFDIYTVAEWTEQKVLPMYKELARIKAEADALKKRRTWPARPFEVSPELAALGIVASSSGTYESSPKRRLNAAVSSKQPVASELSRGRAQAPQPVYYSSQNSNSNNNVRSSDSWQQLINNGLGGGGGRGSVIEVTNGRTKRLVQAPDNYRHPHGY